MKTSAIFAAFVLAMCLALAPAMFGELPDGIAEVTSSIELEALQASEAGTARREAAGQKLCNKERGPNSEARWTTDGDLVCTVRNGYRKVSL